MCFFKTISPGEALVLTYYGKYIGTCRKPGYYWIRPCSTINIISLKSNHYNGNMIKVNDKDGTPVLIGLVCVWKVKDTVKATYCVNNFSGFMVSQTESAIRYIANKFSYDSTEENELTLKSGNEDINTLIDGYYNNISIENSYFHDINGKLAETSIILNSQYSTSFKKSLI